MASRHSRRRFLSIAGGTAAGLSVTGAAFYSATELTSASAAETDFSGVTTPQHTELTAFKDPLRITPVLKPKGNGTNEIEMVNKEVRLHSELPPVPMWTYAGHFPGPTIEARRGEHLQFKWTNTLTGTSPLKSVYVPPTGPPPGFGPYNAPGSGGAPVRPDLAALTPWTSVHLHGGYQHGIYDGHADGAITPGSSQLATYLNEKPAHLFYHDHAMPVTGPNVLSGLVGSYLVRDGREDALDLPKGDHEIVLSIADINFETDAQGRLEGRILNKRAVVGKPAVPGANPPAIAFMGPFTMVNGVVWPHLDVEARAYRFRLINNALLRPYLLALVDETTGKAVQGAMTVIGTDGGLLDKPRVVEERISFMPAERIDIVIDFAQFAGKRLRFVNTVQGVPAGTAVPAAGLQNPEVMQFRVATKRHPSYSVPRKLSATFRPTTLKQVPADAVERFVALFTDTTGMPGVQELQEVGTDVKPGPGIVQLVLDGRTRTFRVTANYFEDRTGFFVKSGGYEVWTFINAGANPIPHPMHIHLMDFQLLQRNALTGIINPATQGTDKPLTLADPIPIAPEESGPKDTVQALPNSIVRVAGRFGQQTGRYMYHCHILDHEDDGMMRPMVIMPASVLEVQKRQMGMMGMGTDGMPGTAMPGMRM